MTDHAELRRLAEQISALTELNDKGVTAPRVPNAAIKLLSKSAAAILALLDEIAALRGRAQQAETLIEHWKMRAASARNDALGEAAEANHDAI